MPVENILLLKVISQDNIGIRSLAWNPFLVQPTWTKNWADESLGFKLCYTSLNYYSVSSISLFLLLLLFLEVYNFLER